MKLTTHVSVEGFFQDLVQEALERTCIEATVGTEYYLVNLMGRFANRTPTDEPLSIKLVECQDDPAERVQVLTEVGDTSLYVAGYFAESLEHGLLDADYYIDLGGAAYRELAARLATSSAAEIYQELATKFPRFVDLLGEVRKQVDFASGDIVRLYQQWLATREQWLEHRLRALGVLVGGDDGPDNVLQ